MAKTMAGSVKLKGTFEVLSGDEETWLGGDGDVKLTRVLGAQRFEGDIEGDGSIAWLMCYRPDGSARLVGMQRIEGAMAGRSGSLVMEAVGDHDGQSSTATWKVVPGTGTGDLAGVRGNGRFVARGKRVDYELELELA